MEYDVVAIKTMFLHSKNWKQPGTQWVVRDEPCDKGLCIYSLNKLSLVHSTP